MGTRGFHTWLTSCAPAGAEACSPVGQARECLTAGLHVAHNPSVVPRPSSTAKRRGVLENPQRIATGVSGTTDLVSSRASGGQVLARGENPWKAGHRRAGSPEGTTLASGAHHTGLRPVAPCGAPDLLGAGYQGFSPLANTLRPCRGGSLPSRRSGTPCLTAVCTWPISGWLCPGLPQLPNVAAFWRTRSVQRPDCQA
jgi:hypothetical protein